MGIPSPFVGSPGWKACCGVQNLHNSGRTSLVLLFSSLWVTYPAGMGFDFIVIVLLLPSCCGFFFVFGHGVSFFGMFQHPSMDGCSIGSGDFGNLKGGDEHLSFYFAIWNQKLVNISYHCAIRLFLVSRCSSALLQEMYLFAFFKKLFP